jgi:hypothetical protein
MSSAGTNGTDVGTTLTTQSDLLYRDGSGLQRLPKGSANQLLRINSGATAPEWHTPATVDLTNLSASNLTSGTIPTARINALPAGVGGKILQVVHGSHTGQVTAQTTSYIDIGSGTNLTITPSATSSKILMLAHFNECYISSTTGATSHYLRINCAGSTVHEMHTTYTTSLTGEEMFSQDLMSVHSPNSTSALSYKLQFRGLNTNTIRVNQNQATGGTTLTLMEIGA